METERIKESGSAEEKLAVPTFGLRMTSGQVRPQPADPQNKRHVTILGANSAAPLNFPNTNDPPDTQCVSKSIHLTQVGKVIFTLWKGWEPRILSPDLGQEFKREGN